MKAAANGVPNLSILDGWWIEGWRPDNSNGWGIVGSSATGWEQDDEDANAIYDVIENRSRRSTTAGTSGACRATGFASARTR